MPQHQENPKLFSFVPLFFAGAFLSAISLAWAQGPVILQGAVELPDPAIVPPEKQLPLDSKETLDRVTKAIGVKEAPSTTAPAKRIVIDRAKTKDPYLSETKPSASFPIALRDERPEESANVEALAAKAYQAAKVGHLEASIVLYKQVLALAPNYEPAWFGLATSYHRLRQFAQAKPYYADILKVRPNDQAALTNFLALVQEEAPEDALVELKKLEQAEMSLGAVPAQMGMIAIKTGNNREAVQHLRRAMAMEPGNMSYRYNLAIVLDKMGEWNEAAPLYRQLLVAAEHGIAMPGNPNTIRERLAFIQRGEHGN